MSGRLWNGVFVLPVNTYFHNTISVKDNYSIYRADNNGKNL